MNMNDARLQTLTVTNFRSIRDTVAIDLDAPVVLLHGQNGAGKTTVMSALELALNLDPPFGWVGGASVGGFG